MRIAVDALPISNFSGRHVLGGLISQLIAQTRDRHDVVVFRNLQNADLEHRIRGARFVEAPVDGNAWLGRMRWQTMHMQALIEAQECDVLLSTSGALVPRVRVPQVVLAQNPWCFIPAFHHGPAQRIKALLQRVGYAQAQRNARALCYLSSYIGAEYRRNAGVRCQDERVVYVGLDDERFASGCASFEERAPVVLAVSVMARHKAIEEVVDSFAAVLEEAPDAQLRLAGPWSDEGYRTEIEARCDALGIAERVTVTGELTEAALMSEYSTARVFCLLSRCESFGIPAVEAQARGTPTVVADACAPPEVAGPGGYVVPPGDTAAAAAALRELLQDGAAWTRASAAALLNAQRFRWANVARPLIQLFDEIDCERRAEVHRA